MAHNRKFTHFSDETLTEAMAHYYDEANRHVNRLKQQRALKFLLNFDHYRELLKDRSYFSRLPWAYDYQRINNMARVEGMIERYLKEKEMGRA